MQLSVEHSWQPTVTEATAIQKSLRNRVIEADTAGEINTVAGVDVGFEDNGRTARAAVAVLAFPSLQTLECSIARDRTRMPYISGYLSFRELPVVFKALDKLKQVPDLFLCDGQGRAHPRRFGIACHLGVLTDIPAIGVAKSRLYGDYTEPGPDKGEQAYLYAGEEIIGAVVRTRSRVKPVFVSVGHRLTLQTAVEYVLACTTKYRLPETTRIADKLASNR